MVFHCNAGTQFGVHALYEEAHHLFGLFFSLYFLLFPAHKQYAHTHTHLMLDITIPYIFWLLSHIQFFVAVHLLKEICEAAMSHNNKVHNQTHSERATERKHRMPSFRQRIHLLNMHCVPIVRWMVAAPLRRERWLRIGGGRTILLKRLSKLVLLISAHDKGRATNTDNRHTESNPNKLKENCSFHKSNWIKWNRLHKIN